MFLSLYGLCAGILDYLHAKDFSLQLYLRLFPSHDSLILIDHGLTPNRAAME